MPYTVSSYPAGTFCWVDFVSKDMPVSKAFYEKLFNWTSEDMPTGDNFPDYTMFYLEGEDTAGGSPLWDKNMFPAWFSYISVDNLDEVVQKAKQLGAQVVAEPMDVLESGRMASIIDPTGAMISFWQPKKHIGARVVNKPGAFCWNELYTKDIAKAKQFYGDLFGWTFNADESGYVTIKNGGRSNGGMFAITEEMGNMPPFWAVYFSVENIEKMVERTEQLGGKLHMPVREVGVGKIAMVSDPTGLAFMMLEMNVKPDEWDL